MMFSHDLAVPSYQKKECLRSPLIFDNSNSKQLFVD